jgi:hypothetical protein
MLTAQLMASMDDEHLLAAALAELDPLTSTALETELLARFERLLEHKPFIDLVEEHEINTDELDALGQALGAGVGIGELTTTIGVLEEFNATDTATLRQKLERADKFYDIANDTGDVIARLNDLINNTL